MSKINRKIVLFALSLAALPLSPYAAGMDSTNGSMNHSGSMKMESKDNPSSQCKTCCMKMMNDSSEKHQQMMNEMMMTELGNKDANYDDRFLDLMIAHHESALMMAEDALQKTERPEIKQMSQDIITAQKKEIAQMKEWRKQWYGH